MPNIPELKVGNTTYDLHDKRVDDLKNTTNYVAGFQSGKKLIVEYTKKPDAVSDNLRITFPDSAKLRIYDEVTGTSIYDSNEYAGVTFSLNNLDKLVYSKTANTISITQAFSPSGNSILLLSLSSGSLFGCIAPLVYDSVYLHSDVSCYLSGPTKPEFSVNGDNLNVKLPACDIRLISSEGLKYKRVLNEAQEYQLGNAHNRLVMSLVTGDISVISQSATTITNTITLLTYSYDACDGVLAPYYYSYMSSISNSKIELLSTARVYFSGPSEPDWIVYGDSRIGIKIKQGVTLRVYRNGGDAITYSPQSDEVYIVGLFNSALVFNVNSNTIYVKNVVTSNKEELLLLSYNNYTCDGLLAPYFYSSSVRRLVDVYRGKLAPVMYCQRWNQQKGYDERTICDARIAFITDIHRADKGKPFQQMLNFTNYLGNDWFDVIINGGDTVIDGCQESLDWYNDMVDTSSLPILNCVGNHDVWVTGISQEKVPSTDTYQFITKKVAETADITQPSNAESNGYNYYYKDINNVRIIVLDVMNWDSTQKAWFSSALNDAKVNSKHVLGVAHGGFVSYSIMTYPPVPRNSYDKRGRGSDGYGLNTEAAAEVYSFMQDGGYFICWLSGHTHADSVAYLPDYGNQYIVFTTTVRDGATTTPKSRDYDDLSYTAFDCIGIDTSECTIRFQRVGADVNFNMVQLDKLCINYRDHNILN